MPGLMTSVASPPLPVAPTNTLVLASLPPSFFHPLILNALKDHFALYGDIHTFAPLRVFGRAIIVYYENHAAEKGKLSLDGIELGGVIGFPRVTLRVYRGAPTPLDLPSTSDHDPQRQDPYHLAPPLSSKNFLISPPGSPPIGWAPIKEDPPNATPLADDLIAALRRLQDEQSIRGDKVRRSENGRSEILWGPEETPAGIGVNIEDWGQSEELSVDEDPEWLFGVPAGRPKDVLPRTSMPSIAPR